MLRMNALKKNNQYAITYNNAQIQATDQKQMKNKKKHTNSKSRHEKYSTSVADRV